MERPPLKLANVQVDEQDFAFFALGLDTPDFIRPTEVKSYRTDKRALALVSAVQQGKDIAGTDFSGINLTGADLSGADLSGVNLSGAVCYKTRFNRANLAGANFSDAYVEAVDFSDADLTDAEFKHAFIRDVRTDGANMSAALKNRFSAMEAMIKAIESGALDIRFLTRADLNRLDLRRIDLSRVDLEGIDLSAFVLEGVNLCGVHINPAVLMSMNDLRRHQLDVKKMADKAVKRATLKLEQENREALAFYAKDELKKKDKKASMKKKKLSRPAMKGTGQVPVDVNTGTNALDRPKKVRGRGPTARGARGRKEHGN